MIDRSQFLLLLPLFLISHSFSQNKSSLDRLAIEVSRESRPFVYTNKHTAFLYGETNADNTTSWQGFNVFGHEFLDDYTLLVDGEKLDRHSAVKTIVYPDYLERRYPQGIIEQIRPVDGVALFAVIVTSKKPVELGVVPYFADGRTQDDFEIELGNSSLLIARKNHLARTDSENYPVWLAVFGEGFSPRKEDTRHGMQYSPALLYSPKQKAHIISFGVADAHNDAMVLARGYAGKAADYFRERRSRMEQLLVETRVETDDARFNKALAWAKLSLDALVMNQVTKGIFAGLPWFNNYWGRDTFIALPGAALVTGQFSEARDILRSFAEYQQTDSTSVDYGRIPNIVTTTDMAYNTADGTPRFIMMAKEYVERSGDTAFMAEIYPSVLRSIEGTILYHTDSLGFLTHDPAETWMDAVGPAGPWSPRGNRANDVQALWAQQLDAGVWFATKVGDAASASRWNVELRLVRKNFPVYFVSNGAVVDHLLPDGSSGSEVRPNQLFTTFLLDDSMAARSLHTVVNELTYPYGVASLSQNNPNFHPFHEYSPYYPKDAAYHNGTVWTWLQGKEISELCRFDKQDFAYELTRNTVHQILDRGAVGTQSELLDAIPRSGEKEPRLSGTVSQAWNLAEFIRTFYDDYLGVRVALLDHKLVLRPHMPSGWRSVRATINLEGRKLPITMKRNPNGFGIDIDGSNLKHGGTGTIQLPTTNGKILSNFEIPPAAKLRIEMKDSSITYYVNNSKAELSIYHLVSTNYDRLLEPLKFQTPAIAKGLAAMKGPDYPLLSLDEVKRVPSNARVILDVSDPAGDDVGSGAYKYPQNPNFISGIFDLIHFTVKADEENAYFLLEYRALSNPGWHPEYGFQLTYAAIAIDQDQQPGSGSVIVPRNAQYVLDSLHAFERLILVGGGVEIEDSAGRILAAYSPIPEDAKDPVGSVNSGIITFTIPLGYLGTAPDRWTFTVLSGGQDDHGGAGIGEFRTVNREAGEWNGGGKPDAGGPNIYDILVSPTNK